MQKNIAISVLDATDIPALLHEIKEQKTKYESLEKTFDTWIHFDVMDGKFVPNTGIDLKYIKTAKNLGLYADTHLMVAKPIGDNFVEQAIANGTDQLTIHFEVPSFEAVLNRLNMIKQEMKESQNREFSIGVSIKPETPVSDVAKVTSHFDTLLIMSVEPGKGGQTYLESTNQKILDAKRIFPKKRIQIDGGINFNTFETPVTLGVDSFVMGSYLTKQKDPYATMLAFTMLTERMQLPRDANLEFDKRLLQIVPGGYGEKDLYLGISVPTLRKFTNQWASKVPLATLLPFLVSPYHDDRRIATFCLTNKMKKLVSAKQIDQKAIEDIVAIMDENITSFNNWDLTDEIAPNVLGKYLLLLDNTAKKEKLAPYLASEYLWKKRIGVISLLTLARAGEKDLILEICRDTMYHPHHLIQKATGWVLREVYKKHPKELVAFLKERYQENIFSSIIMSYACEKMTKKEKEEIKEK